MTESSNLLNHHKVIDTDRRQNLSTPIHQIQLQNHFHAVSNHQIRHTTQSWETVSEDSKVVDHQDQD